jgi:hypothetical protein
MNEEREKPMKKVIVLAIIVFVLLVSVVPVSAGGNGNDGIAENCKYQQEMYPQQFELLYGTIGACVSAYSTIPVDFCSASWEVFGFENMGECVAFTQ